MFLLCWGLCWDWRPRIKQIDTNWLQIDQIISIRQFQDWEKRVDQNSQQQDPTKQCRPCKPRSGSFQWAWKPAGPVESDVELQRSWKRKAHTWVLAGATSLDWPKKQHQTTTIIHHHLPSSTIIHHHHIHHHSHPSSSISFCAVYRSFRDKRHQFQSAGRRFRSMLIENLQDRCTLKLTAEFLWNLSVSSPVDCRLTLVTFSPLLSDLSGSSDPTRQHLDHHWFIIMSKCSPWKLPFWAISNVWTKPVQSKLPRLRTDPGLLCHGWAESWKALGGCQRFQDAQIDHSILGQDLSMGRTERWKKPGLRSHSVIA